MIQALLHVLGAVAALALTLMVLVGVQLLESFRVGAGPSTCRGPGGQPAARRGSVRVLDRRYNTEPGLAATIAHVSRSELPPGMLAWARIPPVRPSSG